MNTVIVFFALVLLPLLNAIHCKGVCVPSSCGNIRNISHPFRLKSDPKSCGVAGYELSCESNSTLILSLAGVGKLNVKAINYNNFTIRVADPSLHADDCSTVPRIHLRTLVFDSMSILSYAWYRNDGRRSWYTAESVNLIKCRNPVDSLKYVGMNGCVRGDSSTYNYAYIGEVTGYELMANCSLELLTMMPRSGDFSKKMGSYVEIHKEMAFGFELSWHNFLCPKCASFGCSIDTATFVPGDCQDYLYTYAAVNSLQDAFKWWRLNVSPLSWWLSNIFHVFRTHFEYSIPISETRVELESVHPIYRFLCLSLYELTCVGLFLLLRFLIGAPLIATFLIYKWRRRHHSEYNSIEKFLQSQNNLMPIRYSFSDIKKMTHNFKESLGKGGFGSVYKGKLRSGAFVAVKMLENHKTNGQDFINEVATIGRIHHASIVQLLGFCCEKSKYALIYEFMPNGSLEKHDVSRNTLSWEQLHKIAVGVARGIEYLHHGCEMQILHFDIKPHNILLDENFLPKISDFGLAKFYPRRGNVGSLTGAKGTIGYMAPELFYKNIGAVSHKADVYSFGMLLLEMAGKRKNLRSLFENSGQSYYSSWIYEQLFDENFALGDATTEENKIARKLIIVGLWCIQMQPSNRPAMNKVVEMLEGEIDSLKLPPRPLEYTSELRQSSRAESSTMSRSFAELSNSLIENEIEFTESSSLIYT